MSTSVPQMAWPARMNELPKEMFVREDIFALERERIFRGQEWHAVAHAAEVPNVGDFKTFEDIPEGDFRRTNPRFQGENFQRNLDLVAEIEEMARRSPK